MANWNAAADLDVRSISYLMKRQKLLVTILETMTGVRHGKGQAGIQNLLQSKTSDSRCFVYMKTVLQLLLASNQ